MNRDYHFTNWSRVVCRLIMMIIMCGIWLPALAINSASYHDGIEYWIHYHNRNRAGYSAEAGGLLPPYIWASGCCPTATAMVLGYWDNHGTWNNTAYGGDSGTGKFTNWGDLIRFYQDSQYIESIPAAGGGGNYTTQWNHVYSPDLLVDLANAMETNAAGSTYNINFESGVNQVTSGRGYGSNWPNYYATIPIFYPTRWTKIKEEINNDRPCMWLMKHYEGGHCVAVWGYVEGGTYDKYVILYNTWDELKREWPIDSDWTKSYGVLAITPQSGIGNQDIFYHSPQSGSYFGGSTMAIRWYQYGTATDNVWLQYSTNGGCSWSTIVSSLSSSQDWNSYSWIVPTTIDSSRVKIRIIAYQGFTRLASDGNMTNLSITSEPIKYTLSVKSSEVSGVSISSTTGHGGTTNYTRMVASGTTVSLTAPPTVGIMSFTGWTGAVTTSDRTIDFSMTGSRTVTANYQPQTIYYTLTVKSSGVSGVSISSTTGHGGTTNYTRTVASGTTVSLTAPPTVGKMEFTTWDWEIITSGQTIDFSMTRPRTVTANYSTLIVTISGLVRDSENEGIEDVNMSYGEPEKLDQKQEEAVNGFILFSHVERSQEFRPTGNKLCKVDILISKAGNPGNLILHIRDMDYQSLWNNVIDGSQVPQGESWVSVPIEPSLSLVPEETYRICVSASNSPDSDNRYGWSFGESGFAFRTYSGDLSISTDAEGYYRINVWPGWSGTTTLEKEGYTFSPEFRTYTNVTSDQSAQDYIATLIQYTLTINASTGGTTDPSPGDYTYDHGTQVNITTTPGSGYRFSHWTGNVPSGHENDNPITITMDSDKSVTANFIHQYTLTIAAGTGGTTNPPPGDHIYDSGTEVPITATPESGYRFSGWTGNVPSGHENDNPITITMDSDKSVTANFIHQYTLTIVADTGGTTDPVLGSYTHDSGTEVNITAIPDDNYRFSGWTGDVPFGHENDNPLSITIDSDKSITANFIRQYTMTIAAGTGGTTDPIPGNYIYDSGIAVSIRAIPYSAYEFSGWSGDATGTTNPITITMDADKSITANFTAISTGDGDSGKKGGCFIATAAYGSLLHPYVRILRDFRDRYLMPSKLGSKLVDIYYKYSPSVADFIMKHKVLKIAVRINLLPLVVFSYSMFHFGPIITLVMIIIIFVFPIFLISFFRRKLMRAEAKDLKASASR